MFERNALTLINQGNDATWLVALALLGVIVGVVLFFKGFRMLRYKRLILNTPVSKVRSASIGLVEVSGMPGGPQTIPSGITGQPCYYYRARAWMYSESDKGGKWAQVADETLFVPFFLEDGTGQVLINPQGAQLDVHKSFVDEVPTSAFGPDSVIPESVRNFVIRRGLLAGSKIKLEEQIIKPGFPLFVFGTLGDNPGPTSWIPMPHVRSFNISLGSNVSPLSDSSHSASLKFNFKTVGSGAGLKTMADMLARLPGTKNVNWQVMRMPSGAPVVLPESAMTALKQLGISVPPSITVESAKPASGLTVDAKWQVATSTLTADPVVEQAPPAPATSEAQPAPDPRYDLHARVAIGQGQRGDPFTISSQSQREVVQALAWKSALYIWGSPIFVLVCIYFLVAYWTGQ